MSADVILELILFYCECNFARSGQAAGTVIFARVKFCPHAHFHLIRFTSTVAVNNSDLFKNTEVAEDVFHIEEKYFDSWNEVIFRKNLL